MRMDSICCWILKLRFIICGLRTLKKEYQFVYQLLHLFYYAPQAIITFAELYIYIYVGKMPYNRTQFVLGVESLVYINRVSNF